MTLSELRKGDYPIFYQPYLDVLGEVGLMDMLRRQLDNFPRFIQSIPESHWNHAYADGKWTVVEVLLHVIDAERVFQYRALRFARLDATPLPGFDQDGYVPESFASARAPESIVEEYLAVRKSTIALFSTFDRTVLDRRGTQNSDSMSVGALGFICCGHQKYHRNIIRERYLG